MIFIHQMPAKDVIGCVAEGFVTPPWKLGLKGHTAARRKKYNNLIKSCIEDIDMIEIHFVQTCDILERFAGNPPHNIIDASPIAGELLSG